MGIYPRPQAKLFKCAFCLEDRNPSRGHAYCQRCEYALCYECFREMNDFKQAFRHSHAHLPPPSSTYAPSVTSVATSRFHREFDQFAVDWDRQSAHSLANTVTSRGTSVRVLEPI